MSTETEFRVLIARIRSRDDQAARELVERYEPVVRRAVRFRLTDAALRTSFDSMDLTQSVLGSFFVRAAAGQYDLKDPNHLMKLLVTMARNKLASRVRRERALQRGHGHQRQECHAELAQTRTGPDPSRALVARELLEEVFRRLTPEERELVEMRNSGQDWAGIAQLKGMSASVLRKRFSRAIARVGRELGFDDE